LSDDQGVPPAAAARHAQSESEAIFTKRAVRTVRRTPLRI
jgi:hypothetical protein